MTEEAANTAERQIGIQKIYVKDFSFESPQSPDVFSSGEWKPKTNLNLSSSHSTVKDNLFEVLLTITIEAEQDEKTMFLIEIQQAGLFHVAGYSADEFSAIVGSFCPSILFPYAREAIASVISRGGFPEFLLQPINFDALYAQSKQQAAANNGAETH